ncbi:hypothetical protein NQ317_016617, partial [Molorchus minor]
GIILYGMVLGQLPFVNNRCDAATSQERRKRLVAQINRGLAAPHRRAIAGFSAEFRHLMNRLLVADSSKRITTKELLSHPWITDKGRKLVRTNPFKILDSHWQAKVISLFVFYNRQMPGKEINFRGKYVVIEIESKCAGSSHLEKLQFLLKDLETSLFGASGSRIHARHQKQPRRCSHQTLREKLSGGGAVLDRGSTHITRNSYEDAFTKPEERNSAV